MRVRNIRKHNSQQQRENTNMSLLLRNEVQDALNDVGLGDYHIDVNGWNAPTIVSRCGQQLIGIENIKFTRQNPSKAEVKIAANLISEWLAEHKPVISTWLKAKQQLVINKAAWVSSAKKRKPKSSSKIYRCSLMGMSERAIELSGYDATAELYTIQYAQQDDYNVIVHVIYDKSGTQVKRYYAASTIMNDLNFQPSLDLTEVNKACKHLATFRKYDRARTAVEDALAKMKVCRL